ncbi:hypothetical protein XU18_4365 [Perkinsela sp. CCAP 1560/4]|nr:hypothetical protein XU18_4365 [Perkinsela sp. CCAP 1560/4]|eukprot:KNH04358.1 hypothetical protein XU18_4365 [Perkinsela sp. CCAP 1560/4]
MVRHSANRLTRRVDALAGVHSQQIDCFIEATQCVGTLRNSEIPEHASADDPIDPTSACISPPLQRTGRRVAPRSCSGCIGFRCVKHWTRYEDVPTGKNAEKWLRSHKFMCAWLWSHNCRTRVSEYEPIFGLISRVTFGQVLMFWAKLAGLCSIAEIVQSVYINTNTLTLLMRAAGVPYHKYLSTCDVKFSRLAVDETYFGKRKYSKGKRACFRGYWFVTATELNIDGSTGCTVSKLVKRRERQTARYKYRTIHSNDTN